MAHRRSAVILDSGQADSDTVVQAFTDIGITAARTDMVVQGKELSRTTTKGRHAAATIGTIITGGADYPSRLL